MALLRMHAHDDQLGLSAGDLGRFLACRHLTELDRAAAEGRLAAPVYRDVRLEQLQARGFEHEAAYVARLAEAGRDVVELRSFDGADAEAQTLAAMRAGPGVIVQARLRSEGWLGIADLLVRVETPSDLGSWSYEVVDTKLARETRAATILQLCLYSELIGRVQGVAPVRFHVVKPGAGAGTGADADPGTPPFETESYRFADFAAYHRLVRARLEAAVGSARDPSTYPYPVEQCDICRWWKHCDDRRHEDDHLTLVAGIRSAQVAELEGQGVTTLEAFAEEPAPLRKAPARGSVEAFGAAWAQARIQLAGRRAGGAPTHELIDFEPGRGLARLPAPDAGDVFLDLEGDHFVGDGGLEYVFGYAFRPAGSGALAYESMWAHDRAQERRAFERFVDFVMARWEAHPGMHVYHFGHYEPGAMKRLAMRHATREEAIDRLLRGERFVDLYRIVLQGVRASVERYSIKDLEPFFGFERGVELREASHALRRVECALEAGGDVAAAIDDADRLLVEGYNRDDCLATEALRGWLESCRAALVADGVDVERPPLEDGTGSEEAEERSAEVEAVYQALVAGLGEDRDAWSEADAARWLLAHELEYFRREDKCAWWEYFRLAELAPGECFDEKGAVAGLVYEGAVGGTASCPHHRYRFPPQALALDRGDTLHAPDPDDPEQACGLGSIEAIDDDAGTIDVKKTKKARDLHPPHAFAFSLIRKDPLPAALLALGRAVAASGVDGPGPFRAARDLLRRRPPRLASGATGDLRGPGEETIDAAIRLVNDLDEGVLAIQGPPGTGKTYTGAHVIADLVRRGKRVGITAVSHKVVRNLLTNAIEVARETGVSLAAVQKGGRPDGLPDGLRLAKNNDAALAALADGAVVGGTAWLWARDDAVERLDYLFVDEAGQMSLALVLAAARSARNIVLLGDPQQLEQPQQGTHPEGADVAALVHVLGGEQTIPADRGLFLDTTWRLHPDICAFTSELYYEDRLDPHPDLHRQVVHGDGPFAGSGLFFVPVPHADNQTRAPEEVDAIGRIVDDLLTGGATWTDREGATRPLTPNDFRVVAPYNDQVGALTARLGDVPVGTVDKFQGQQAAIVIYSMTTSCAADAPRGLGFLYSPNRLNVATSRAKCACILVASPGVFEAECRTPEQMRWVNGVCRFRERAVCVDPDVVMAGRA